MHRTSVYFEEDALKALKLLAATSGVSVAGKVREAVHAMLTAQVGAIDLSSPEIVEAVQASRRKGLHSRAYSCGPKSLIGYERNNISFVGISEQT